MGEAARIDACGLIVFVYQGFEITQRAVGFGAGEGWCEVINDHGLGAAFGLGAFARIVHDKRVDVGCWTEDCFGQAGLRQGQRFAWQPFEVAVFAHVDQRMCTVGVAQVEVKGEVVVRWDEVGGVVGVFGIDVIAAGGLYADKGIAEIEDGEGKVAFSEERVCFGCAPAGFDLIADVEREFFVVVEVVRKGKLCAAYALRAIGEPVGGANHDLGHQGIAVGGNVFDGVAVLGECVEGVNRGGGGVEADAVCKAAIFVGVVGEDENGFAIFGFCGAKDGPVFGELGHEIDAVAHGAVGGDGAFGGLVKIGFAFERNGAGQDAAVHFWQGHVHGDVAGGEAVQSFGPRGLRSA